MLALGAMLLAFESAPVAAAEMQPGLWRFTQQTVAGGRGRRSQSTRCVGVAQAKDPVRFFAPRVRGGRCEITENTAFGGRVSARMRCTGGTEVASVVSIDSPTHLTLSTTLTASRGGRSVTMQTTGEGTRTGNCRG